VAKQYYTLRSFARGMNSLRDPRDIGEDEAHEIHNMSIDSVGKIKTQGGLYGHGVGHDGTGSVPDGKYIADRGGSGDDAAVLVGAGGYNLFYFESDHSIADEESISHRTSDGSNNTDGEITFINPSTRSSSGFTKSGSAGYETVDQDNQSE
jgi:hypothetical protein